MLEHSIIQELQQGVPKLDVVSADGLDRQPKVSVLLRNRQWVRHIVVGECIRFLEQFHSSLAVVMIAARVLVIIKGCIVGVVFWRELTGTMGAKSMHNTNGSTTPVLHILALHRRNLRQA